MQIHGTCTWTASGVAGQRAGYKIFLGDIPPHTRREQLLDWMYNDPAIASDFRNHMVDMTVTGGSATGAMKAIIVMDSEASAMNLYEGMHRWWAPCPASVQSRGWRWLSIRFIDA